jgi:GTP cyclohydrolase II
VEANRYLGLSGRTPGANEVAAAAIKLLGIRSIRLMTNNPDKIEKIRAAGIEVTGRIHMVIEPNAYDERYIQTKRERMGHMY